MYILSEQRHEDVSAAFARYRRYLREVREKLPPGARNLAESEWYFDPRDHRCPHDAWLEEVRILEPHSGPRKEVRRTAIHVRLLGAYHDRTIELRYIDVASYSFTMQQALHGHRDWRYDEIRAVPDGGIIHEIEWCGSENTGKWLIQAADLEYQCILFD